MQFINCSFGQTNQLVDKVLEYCPAPGQFVNTPIGCPRAATAFEAADEGSITLGGFGGYVVFKLAHPIVNDPQNPYGVDFSIYGNATIYSAEPASVWVMVDSNQNGLPDETWFVLAGSDYWFSTSVPDYQVTYTNPGSTLAADVPWTDNLGQSGFIPANEYHTQPYYPLADSFPSINQSHYSLSGEYIRARIDSSNSTFIVTKHYPFGYADNTPKNLQVSSLYPDNPYTSVIEGAGGDAFDLSWAVDGNGNYIHLDSVHFIKIQNSVNLNAGWIGELSTEILRLVDVSPDNSLVGDSALVVIEPLKNPTSIDVPVQLNAFLFNWGRYQKDKQLTWSLKDTSLAVIGESGMFTPKSEGEVMVFVADPENPAIKDSLEVVIKSNVSINFQKQTDIMVYPNPASDVLQIHGINSIASFQIMDIMGTLVKSGSINEMNIDISDLRKGCYLLMVDNGSAIASFRFIKL